LLLLPLKAYQQTRQAEEMRLKLKPTGLKAKKNLIHGSSFWRAMNQVLLKNNNPKSAGKIYSSKKQKGKRKRLLCEEPHKINATKKSAQAIFK